MYKVDDRDKIRKFLGNKGCTISDWAEDPEYLAVNRAIVANALRENLNNTALSEDNKKLMDCVLFLYKKSHSYFQAEAQGWYLQRMRAYYPERFKKTPEEKAKNKKNNKEPVKSIYDKIIDDVSKYLEKNQINLEQIDDLMNKVMKYIDKIANDYDMYSDEDIYQYTLRTSDIMQQNKQEQSNKR